MKNRQNMGGLDRLGRLVIGLALIATGLFVATASGWKVIAIAVGAVLVTTAAAGICPGYFPFGITTRRPWLGAR